MALENVPHRLITDGVSQVGEGPHDPVVAPRTIFLGHADNQGLQISGNFWTAWRRPPLRTIKLLGDQGAVPAEDSIGLDDSGDFRERLLPQLVADLRQGLP